MTKTKSPKKILVHHKVLIDASVEPLKRLDKVLSSALPHLSRSRLKSLILEGHVTLQGNPIQDPDFKVLLNQEFLVEEPAPEEATPKGEDIALDIIYEDAHLLVINNPAGLVVHPAPGNRTGTLVNALIAYCGDQLSGIGGVRRPGIVHRLDKDTSGLMVVAKTDAAHQGLSSQFANRDLSRTYQAFVMGVLDPDSGVINKNIGRSLKNRQKMATFKERGKEAITLYETKETYGNVLASLVECKLKTGRTHQIRVHLSDLGHPLIGDPIYGKSRQTNPLLKKISSDAISFRWEKGRQALHASELSFIHPITFKKENFSVELPQDLKDLKKILETL
jgi:23S rRNA pseudouridine1911/1915/1917 synthase